MRLLYVVLAFCNILWEVSLSQNNYKMRLERFEVEYDKNFGSAEFNLFYVNRTARALNLTGRIYNDIPFSTDYFLELKVYEFLNNEYKLFGINSRYILCHFLQTVYKNIFWKDMMDFLPPRCPIKKGVYIVRNYIPTQNSIPNLPFKKVRVEIIVLLKQTEILKITVYIQFDRDSWYREQYS